MSNLTATTREAWSRSVEDQVYMKNILLSMLIEREQVVFPAGTAYKKTVRFADLDLAQEYAENDTLNGGSKTTKKTAQWYRKNIQVPLELTGNEMRAITGGGDGVVIDMMQQLIDDGQRDMRKKLNEIIYRAGSSDYDAETDEHWQGFGDALTHDVTYGGLSRSTTATNKWWQGASIAGTFADGATAITPTLDNFRKAIDAVSQFVDSSDELIAITSPTNWRHLQSQAEAYRVYKDGPVHKQGFTSMFIDDVQVFKEPWLQSNQNSNAATDVLKFYLINLRYWKLMLDKSAALGDVTEWVRQSQMENGTDKYLARVFLHGNIICEQPNSSIYLSNMSM